MPEADSQEPAWLLSLATRARGNVPTSPLAYDPVQQLAVVRSEGRMLPAALTSPPPASKKADIEKGEDQKDRW